MPGVGEKITRMQLFQFLWENNILSRANKAKPKQKMLEYIKQILPSTEEQDANNKISLFSTNILKRWRSSGRNKKSFLKKYAAWLTEDFIISKPKNLLQRYAETPRCFKALKPFVSITSRSKRRRTKHLVDKYTPEELAFAAQSSFTKKGKRNISYAIKKATFSRPQEVKEMKNLNKKEIHPYSPEEALALMVDVKLTKSQYLKLREGTKKRNCNIFPSYAKVLNAKKACYPTEINVTESMAEVNLQNLLDHTAKRLCMVQENVLIQELSNDIFPSLEMFHKWGFDGSSNHAMYKQTFNDNPRESDFDMLLTSIVPLKLVYKRSFKEKTIWQNPRCSSTRFCIPLKFQFVKETREMIKQQSEYIDNQIASLVPTTVEISGKQVSIKHFLFKTMLDGKVANILTDNASSQSCYICGATPKHMNDIEAILKRPSNVNAFQYGLSTLHAHIRLFECILHVSYRLQTQTWRSLGPENKRIVEERKASIISQFRQKTGLLVDTVKQGSGNTNDGNTARRFFKDPKQTAEITGVNEELIFRFSVILQTISCGHDVDTEKYRKYAVDTAKLFVSLYKWYCMPSSVHKILLHGADVMESLLIPIGQLSEDALEARHKEFRYFREHHTRKMSRRENVEDLMHTLLITSDMLISSLRPLPKKIVNTLSTEVQNLLKDFDPEPSHSRSDVTFVRENDCESESSENYSEDESSVPENTSASEDSYDSE